MKALLVCSIFLLLFANTKSKKWTHHVVLNEEAQFELLWTPLHEKVLFEMRVRSHGYLAIGFSPNGGMKGSDIVLAWIDDDGKPYLKDCHALGNAAPVMDPSQDYTLISGYENETHTVVQFSRPVDTCDSDHDMPIRGDTTRLIWAYHDKDPVEGLNDFMYHGATKRGVRSVYLQELAQPVLPQQDLDTIKIWDLVAQNVSLPNEDHTHYWCQIYKAPPMDRKHQMIALRPLIQKGHEAYVHHMVLYECHVPHDSSDAWFADHVKSQGAACYSPNMPPEWTFCLATNAWAWAVGSEGETLPEHVGMPLGEDFGGATYFMLETHYDNQAMHQDLFDSSGIRIYYTDRLRQYDTAMLLVGSEVNFLHLVPPAQHSFKTVGRCTSDCTAQSLPPEGIHILSGVLHSHLAGRKMHLRHVRNGQELPVILQDNHYDFNFQASRQPPKNAGHVLPGDELMLVCDYATSGRQRPTFGGLSTQEEMCLGFILYYPRSPLADCRSLPTLKSAMTAIGIHEIYGKAFEKLVAFMKDIGGGDSNTLHELISVLLTEESKAEEAKKQKEEPLSIEDLLKKPFYTVAEPVEEQRPKATSLLPSLEEVTNENYRTLLPSLLLGVRIKSPPDLHNSTVGQRFADMNWANPTVGKAVQDALFYGSHNSLCLAHGRTPIIPYEEKAFPKIEAAEGDVDTHSSSCSPPAVTKKRRKKKPFHSSSSPIVALGNNGAAFRTHTFNIFLPLFLHLTLDRFKF